MNASQRNPRKHETRQHSVHPSQLSQLNTHNIQEHRKNNSDHPQCPLSRPKTQTTITRTPRSTPRKPPPLQSPNQWATQMPRTAGATRITPSWGPITLSFQIWSRKCWKNTLDCYGMSTRYVREDLASLDLIFLGQSLHRESIQAMSHWKLYEL